MYGKGRTEKEPAACKEWRAEGARGLREPRRQMQKAGEGSAKQLGVRAPRGLLGERGSSLLREASEQRAAGRFLAGRLQRGSLPGLAACTSRPLSSSYGAKSRASERGWLRRGRLGSEQGCADFPVYLALS